MNYTYPTHAYGDTRCMNLKLYTPDNGIVRRFVLALHGFAGDMESDAIELLAKHLTQQQTAVLSFNYAGHGNDTQDALFSLECCLNDFLEAVRFAKQTFPYAQWRGIFATSFGGFLTLNSLQMIPADVRIVLRAPAVNMPQVFARIVGREGGGMDKFAKEGSVVLGYEHRLEVPYTFYNELLAHDVFMQDHDREMLLIHGDRDDVVLPEDTAAFCARNPKIIRKVITGADHLFHKPGELERVMDAAVPWLTD